MKNPLPIRVKDSSGAVFLRDGLLFVLFSKKTHAELAEHAGRFLEAYVKLVGAERLRFIHDSGDSLKPLTEKKWARLRKSLTPSAAAQRQSALFSMADVDHEVRGYFVRYFGEDLSQLEEQERNCMEVGFPTEFPQEVGEGRFLEALLEMAKDFPFTSGYCSLAFNFDDWGAANAEDFIQKKAFRHPGLDIHLSASTSMQIGDKVRGAYWLTFLGPEPLAMLGMSLAQLKSTLGEGIQVHDLKGSIALQAGERPLPGDINSKDNLPLVRTVAKVLEPITLIQERGIFGLKEVDDFIAWQRRHLT